ncbi:receptor expression-enhancing protein 2 isoform X2 [Octopus bimaculoides]|uniref:receptor expression-enhancing protein 2 isoform X2 n=1 Tax=Octopus bimaculoides TaxID=37653 RepID=UPI0022E0BB10|nr:receptor expression-enhancing protein 2 isoform X2 [Octopus bimaculoides]
MKNLFLTVEIFMVPYIYGTCRLIFGTLYPAYASYKAVRTRNVREYVKWMMYWIVFALFTSFETFSDCILSWLPFYYEIKIVFVLWLLSPVTKGSSFLYRKFVHPQLIKREKEIDDYLAHARDAGYSTVLQLGHRGIRYATNVIVKTAIQGQARIANHIYKSYSMSDLSDGYGEPRSRSRIGSIPENDEDEDELDNRLREDNQELEKRIKKEKDSKYLTEEELESRQMQNIAPRGKADLYSVPEESNPSPLSSMTKPYSSYSSRYSSGSSIGYDLRSLSKKEVRSSSYLGYPGYSGTGSLPRHRYSWSSSDYSRAWKH